MVDYLKTMDFQLFVLTRHVIRSNIRNKCLKVLSHDAGATCNEILLLRDVN